MSIYQPSPDHIKPGTYPSASNRMLSSHNSLLELLHQHNGLDELNNNNNNVNNGGNLGFSTSSWQSIGDYLSPRPTSSVLSNSDTEEDADEGAQSTSISSRVGKSIRLNDHDDETIEIDMNEGFVDNRPQYFFNSKTSFTASNFVMPDRFSDTTSFAKGPEGLISGSKILLIGNKKSVFLKRLNKEQRSKFTLTHKAKDVENFKIILIIFDGLLKIGNILNFLKSYNNLNDKFIIPIFKNLNITILNKLLKVYKLNLLCPPINIENDEQIQNLFELLNEDFFLQDSVNQFNHEQGFSTLYSKDLISPNGENFEEFQNHEDHKNFALVKFGNEYTDGQFDDGNEGFRNQSIIIKHHDIKDFGQKSMRSSKKLQSKKHKRQKFYYLSLSLLLGIGIGITSAYTITSMKRTRFIPSSDAHADSSKLLKKVVPSLDALKRLSISSVNLLKSSQSFAKDQLIDFKRNIGNISTVVLSEFKASMVGVVKKWDVWIDGVSSGSLAGSILWYI